MIKSTAQKAALRLKGRKIRKKASPFLLPIRRKLLETKLSLLHGRAAAVMMNEKFGIEDKEILEAVANHVSGCLGLCDLGKVLFLADKTEPGRPQSTDEYRAGLLKLTLDEQYLSVIKENYEYITSRGYEVYPETKKMIEYYEKVVSKAKK